MRTPRQVFKPCPIAIVRQQNMWYYMKDVPARAGRLSGGDALGIQAAFAISAHRRPAAGNRRAGARRQVGHEGSGTAGRYRLGQDIHDGQRDCAPAAPGAHNRAQQDAGGTVGRGVPRILSRKRGGLLCVVLRLLSARGIHRLIRYLYRKGRGHQRRDRPYAPQRDRMAEPNGAT